ncbi:hypothetical protein E2C01_001169 [Portunus trituberculatus]|uniref:Uncharacterized protein n=1 Tax=Portunus trituberculatus TaxID=210409 RepID=A0A5B7CIK9_PORTR|nr:hypothetical protein [Portunus trituberculatus]
MKILPTSPLPPDLPLSASPSSHHYPSRSLSTGIIKDLPHLHHRHHYYLTNSPPPPPPPARGPSLTDITVSWRSVTAWPQHPQALVNRGSEPCRQETNTTMASPSPPTTTASPRPAVSGTAPTH